jgi:hypothetical protein
MPLRLSRASDVVSGCAGLLERPAEALPRAVDVPEHDEREADGMRLRSFPSGG